MIREDGGPRSLGCRFLETAPSINYFPRAGSGVAELRLVFGGFSLPGLLTAKTFAAKTAALILSSASGLCIGKEGPYIHLVTSISSLITGPGDSKAGHRRFQMLRAGAASGLAVAFGTPLSGVVFALEEFRYSFYSVVFGLHRGN